ncbi:MAG: pyruvate carboxyltransferase, partial [Verrucomicrobiae bacterium]|nr:pyruvate carboxyltransferase [Verrucomicrobiae bacterium]
PMMAKLRKELNEKGLPSDDEHCVIHAMFPAQLQAYYDSKKAQAAPKEPQPAAPKEAPPAPARPESVTFQPTGKYKKFGITIGGKKHEVMVEELR